MLKDTRSSPRHQFDFGKDPVWAGPQYTLAAGVLFFTSP